MIQINELIKDLNSLKKKAEFIKDNQPNNSLCNEVCIKIDDLINFIKKDMRLFGYD